MNINQLLGEISSQGVQLSADGEQIRIRAPKGSLSTALRDSLLEHKQELILLLRQLETKQANFWPTIEPQPEQMYQPFPLNDIQQAYWIGKNPGIELNSPAQFYCEIDCENLDLYRLLDAWQKLIDRHDMLRAIVLPTGEQQIFERVPPYQIAVFDLAKLPPARVDERLAAIRDRLIAQELQSDRWPVFALQVSILNEGKLRLHFSFNLLIVDGWSLQILLQELAALARNLDILLPPLELSFRDYMLAKVALQDSRQFQQSWNYWCDRLMTIPPAPELPLTKQTQSRQNDRFVHLSARIEPQTWLKLKNRAQEVGITPTVALCAAYAEVLTTWSKNPRFTLTLLYLNRLPLHPQVDRLVGNFSTNILLEIDNSGTNSFESRAKRLQTQLWTDLENSLVSGTQVLRELNRRQQEIARATMPVTFASLLDRGSSLEEGDRSLWQNLNYSQLKVPQVILDHQVWESNGALIANWDVVEELFPPGMVREMFDAYISFLDRLAFDSELWLSSSPLIIPEKQRQLQVSINATDAPISPKLLHELFSDRVNQGSSNRPAVISSSKTLTYQQLYRRANFLGHYLRELGVVPNQLVAVVMEKGWEQVVGVLAILMAGAAYVPIDPTIPRERQWQLLEQSEVKILLTQEKLDSTRSWPANIQRICVDCFGEDGDLSPILPTIQQAEDLAYVIFTSGSTGLPKGVKIDHRGAVNTILDINQRFKVNPEDKVFAISALNFDLSVYDIFGTLAAGATIVLPDATATKEPARWLDLVIKERVTIWNSVPALMQLLMEYAIGRDLMPSSLRLVLLSGDWLPLNLPVLLGDIQTISLGGATEASIWSILYQIDRVDPRWKSIPYGHPMTNQRFYVLNAKLETCPIWVVGELYIGGIGLARGYWKNQAKTEASFIIHPLTGERLYRTGDLGRYLPDGNIEFLGREDFQVKIQGNRIECGEIEVTLLQHPDVKSAIVTAVGEQQAAKHLIAYIVPHQPNTPTSAQLHDFLAEKLPAYMVPSIFTFLSELPLTNNGKIDRRALPTPAPIESDKTIDRIPPRDFWEFQLAQIWSEILELDSIGVKDSFFELGGYSFAGMRLMGKIQQQFGKTLPLSSLLENPTIEHLASLLRSPTKSFASSVLVPIQPQGNVSPFFCIHPIGGNVLCYVDLAKALGKEQPVYGLQAVGLDGAETPLNCIEDMADRYIKEIRRVQTTGPYYLGGWSLGGMIAWEVARQLCQQGQQIGLLALIDSFLPTPQQQTLDPAMLVLAFARDLSAILGKKISLSIEQLRDLTSEEQLERMLQQAKQIAILPPEVGIEQIRHIFQVFSANHQAMYAYNPLPHSQSVVLFHTSRATPEKRWQELANTDRYEIEADHYSIVREPQVRILADRLKAYLPQS
jgi:amino acid adenylation domain-containing protein